MSAERISEIGRIACGRCGMVEQFSRDSEEALGWVKIETLGAPYDDFETTLPTTYFCPECKLVLEAWLGKETAAVTG